MNPSLKAIQALPRCRAWSKSAKRRCRAPAAYGRPVCYWHGARGGAPEGNINGLIHGGRSADAELERRPTKGFRMGIRAMGKIAPKAAKGRLSPLVGAALPHLDRRAAAASKAEKLRRKKELVEPTGK